MRKPTHHQWAAHYAKRASLFESDASYFRKRGDELEAQRLSRIAEQYREQEARSRMLAATEQAALFGGDPTARKDGVQSATVNSG